MFFLLVSLRAQGRQFLARLYTQPKPLIFILLLAFCLLLNSPSLLPNYSSLNPHDEAKYIASGAQLLNGEVRDLAWGPLVALVYAPAYLLTKASPYFFFYQAFFGRLIILALIWVALAILSDQFSDKHLFWITIGLLFIASPLSVLLQNSSDSLFVPFSALSLACLIRYYRVRTLLALLFGSAFLGLASLVRPDAFILFFIFIVCSLAIQFRHKVKRIHILAIFLPYLVILAAYFVMGGVSPVVSFAGIGERTYFAFEQGQWTVTRGSWDEAVIASRSAFGLPEENNSNILIAITRHPGQFMKRLQAIIGLLPDMILQAYDKRLGVALLFFALIGVIRLIKRREKTLLILLLVWCFNLPAYFFTFFREGYLLLIMPSVLILASLGLAHFIENTHSRLEKALWSVGLAFAISIFVITNKPAFVLIYTTILCTLWLLWLSRPLFQKSNLSLIGGLAFACAGLILRGGFPFPNYPTLGIEPQERIIHKMQTVLPAGSQVVSQLPLVPLAADMVPLNLPPMHHSDQLQAWLIENEIDAIYVDASLISANIDTWNLIEAEIGGTLSSVAIEMNGDIQLLLVSQPTTQ